MNITQRIGWLLAVIAVAGCGGGTDGPVEPPLSPIAITVVSGSGQAGKAGEPLPERLVVRVTDAHGVGVADVAVTWSVTAGSGHILDRGHEGWLVRVTTTRTRSDGLTDVTFLPTQVGRSSVTATVAGLAGAPAIFTADAPVLLIHNGTWGVFLGPNDSTDVTVPVGTPVEWLNYWPALVEIRSTSAPPGGTWFDLTLAEGERVQFVPQVAGSWEWTYQYQNDAGEALGPVERGTLTAEP